VGKGGGRKNIKQNESYPFIGKRRREPGMEAIGGWAHGEKENTKDDI